MYKVVDVSCLGSTAYDILRYRSPSKGERVCIYKLPAKRAQATACEAFVPNYPDSFFQNTPAIDHYWLINRFQEIGNANCQPPVLLLDIADHCQRDFEVAEQFAVYANRNGHNIDLETLKTFAFSHDIGRMATAGRNPRFLETIPTPYHGVIGREIFIYFSERFRQVKRPELSRFCLSLAQMCASHTAGVGFTKKSNEALGILPHGKTTFEDDLVWAGPPEHFVYRLLLGVADAKLIYPNHPFKFQGTATVQHQGCRFIKPSAARLLIDRVVGKIYLCSGNSLANLTYQELIAWDSQQPIVLEFGSGGKTERINIRLGTEEAIELEALGPAGRKEFILPHFELISIEGETIVLQECVTASRAAVHKRYDHFDQRNSGNIDKAFDQVVDLIGKENRNIVDNGWFEPDKIPF